MHHEATVNIPPRFKCDAVQGTERLVHTVKAAVRATRSSYLDTALCACYELSNLSRSLENEEQPMSQHFCGKHNFVLFI